MSHSKVDIAKINEDDIQAYLEQRNHRLTRLDPGGIPDAEEACEWFVESDETSFLCEVKTVQSVKRGRNTESEFKHYFEKPVLDYFAKAKVGTLPYELRIDCDSMYARKRHSNAQEGSVFRKQLDAFLRWLKKSILSIDQKKMPNGWAFRRVPWPRYWSTYTIRHEDGLSSRIHVSLTESKGQGMKVSVYWQGDLNASCIEQNVSKAVSQLRSAGEKYPNVARLVILGFASKVYVLDSEVSASSGLAFKRRELWDCIQSLLHRYDDLSAIATIGWATDSSDDADSCICFTVFHNSDPKGVKPLDRVVFDDGRSVQHSSIAG